MGFDASLKVIPRNEFRKHQKDPAHYVFPKTLSKFDLYREWGRLDKALNRFGPPLSLAIRGNRPTAWEFDDPNMEFYSAFVTPALVKKIDTRLMAVNDDDVIAALQKDGWARRKREHKYYIGSFADLRAAYRAAAGADAYLQIFIC